MRLFLAIELPEEVKNYLFTIKDKFSRDLAKVNWVAKKNIHLTLKFLGEVDDKIVNNILTELKKIKFEKFTLELDNLGVFPNENYIRVLWVGLNNFNKVIELQQDIEEKLSKYFSKDKEFSCHITLGRVKFLKDKKAFNEIIKNIKMEKLKFLVEHFSLIKSYLSKDSPKYSVIETFKL